MNKEVEFLKRADIPSYIELIRDIFGYEADKDSIEKLISQNRVLIIKEDNKVVASAIIEERFEYIKNQKYYFISYLGVSKDYRRNGYASIIFNKIEDMAKENNVKYIELTSGNQRKAAHYFYQSKDFKIKDTTVFIKIY